MINSGDGALQPLARLAVRAGPDAGSELLVRKPVVSLGRGSQNDVVLADDSVSTTHARLEYQGGGWRVTDLGSVNGSYLDGTRLAPDTPTPLAAGSALRLGAVQLQFDPEAAADPESARAAYTPAPPPTRVAERSGGFRLPVWLLALLLVLLAVGVLLFRLTRDEPAPEPAPAGTTVELPAPAPAARL